MTHKLGYGQWDELKAEVRKAWEFRFDWFIKSRTPAELNRRVDALIRLVIKENQEIDEAAQQKRKVSPLHLSLSLSLSLALSLSF